ncbi:hypothetical protein D9M68_694920 [compost metagenome]
MGRGARLFRIAAQADEPGIEGLGIGAQDLGRVAFGVDRDEQHAQLVGVRTQQALDLDGARERRGADVGALRETEEQHHRMALVVGQPACLAIGVLQLEIAVRHAGQVHAVQFRGIGAAAREGEQGQGRQQQAAPGIGRVRRRAGGRAQDGRVHENLVG